MGNLDVDDPGNPRNRERTRESQVQLRALLLQWDPIGVAGIPEAADEYDCMISPLMHLLHDGATRPAIRKWVTGEVEGHFGMRSDRRRESQLAVEVTEWWDNRIAEQ